MDTLHLRADQLANRCFRITQGPATDEGEFNLEMQSQDQTFNCSMGTF